MNAAAYAMQALQRRMEGQARAAGIAGEGDVAALVNEMRDEG